MNDISFGLFYLALICGIVLVPMLLASFVLDMLYKHDPVFRKRFNRFMRRFLM